MLHSKVLRHIFVFYNTIWETFTNNVIKLILIKQLCSQSQDLGKKISEDVCNNQYTQEMF